MGHRQDRQEHADDHDRGGDASLYRAAIVFERRLAGAGAFRGELYLSQARGRRLAGGARRVHAGEHKSGGKYHRGARGDRIQSPIAEPGRVQRASGDQHLQQRRPLARQRHLSAAAQLRRLYWARDHPVFRRIFDRIRSREKCRRGGGGVFVLGLVHEPDHRFWSIFESAPSGDGRRGADF